jgi:hypothetical protein
MDGILGKDNGVHQNADKSLTPFQFTGGFTHRTASATAST